MLVGGSRYPLELVEVCTSWPERHSYHLTKAIVFDKDSEVIDTSWNGKEEVMYYNRYRLQRDKMAKVPSSGIQ